MQTCATARRLVTIPSEFSTLYFFHNVISVTQRRLSSHLGQSGQRLRRALSTMDQLRRLIGRTGDKIDFPTGPRLPQI